MNYFEFYGLPVDFLLDEVQIKKKFLELSRKYHPDFFTLESSEKQEEVLEMSTRNTNAYKVLSDFDARMKYILQIKGALEEEGKASLPNEFLMEMMEVNEKLMELEFDFDADSFETIEHEVNEMEEKLYEGVLPELESFDPEKSTKESLEKVKDYFFKKRYLLRIQENLAKFASK